MRIGMGNNILLTKKNRYYFLYILTMLKKYIFGLLIKSSSFYIYISPLFLQTLLFFFKNNSVCTLNSLLDIAVVDKPFLGINRFELIMCS